MQAASDLPWFQSSVPRLLHLRSEKSSFWQMQMLSCALQRGTCPHKWCACLFPRCNCHALGSTSGQCDIRTGQCECQPGVTGQHCDRCEANHFGFSSEGCKRKSEGPERGRWEGCCTPSLAFAFLLPLGRCSVTSLLIAAEVGTFTSKLCVTKFDFCTIAYPFLLLLPFPCPTY